MENKKLPVLVLAFMLMVASVGFKQMGNANVSMVTRGGAAGQTAIQTQQVTLKDLGSPEPLLLEGPYQQTQLTFALPPDWQVTGSVSVNLQTRVAFPSLMEVFTAQVPESPLASQKGSLEMAVNGVQVLQTTLQEEGEQTLTFVFAAELLNEDLQENELKLTWDASIACAYGITSTITIDPTSAISISYQNKPIETRLVDFPLPFFAKKALKEYPTAILLAGQPDEVELSALMAISAGLGKQSQGGQACEVWWADELQGKNLSAYHLIVVGQLNTLRSLMGETYAELENDLAQAGGTGEAGVLWWTRSPWNAGRTLLVITGQNKQALLKSSAAIASENLVPFSQKNLAMIRELPAAGAKQQLSVDLTFNDLLDEEGVLHVDQLGVSSLNIPFHIPGDVAIAPEAFVELVFRHSQLLNYLRSGLTIAINEKNIGTIRFSDNSAENGLTRIILPPNILHAQKNDLELIFNLSAQDVCADPRGGDYWISVFDQSYIHLPPSLGEEQLQLAEGFSSLPWALLQDDQLADLVFVAHEDYRESWQYAAKIAFKLGSYTDAPVMKPIAKFVEDWLKQPSTQHAILLGRVNSLEQAQVKFSGLELPVAEDGLTDTLRINGIRFALESGSSYGLVGMRARLDSQGQVLAVLGNTTEGLESAVQALDEILGVEQSVVADTRIILQNKVVYDLTLTEEVVPQGENSENELGSLQWLLQLGGNKTVLILLAGSSLITASFIAWAILDEKKKQRIRKLH